MKKRTFATLALLASLAAATPHITKRMAHNIMSHHPVNESLESLVRGWKKFGFTRGDYTGLAGNACGIPESSDINAMYLGLQDVPFEESEDRPTSLTGAEDMTFYDPGCAVRWKNPQFLPLWMNPGELEKVVEMDEGDAVSLSHRGGAHSENNNQTRSDAYGIETDVLTSNYTLSIGKDEKGHYLSFYDAWDFGSKQGGFYNGSHTKIDEITTKILPKLGKPIRLYKRFYFEDYGLDIEDIKSELIDLRSIQ